MFDDGDDFDDFFSADDVAGPKAEESESSLKMPPRLGLLRNLTAEEFTAVARAAQLKHLEPGTAIFLQGDAADRFFILVDGEVEVQRDGARIATLGAGSFFGESALLVDGNRSASVLTTQPSSVWSVDYATFSSVVSPQLLADEETKREVVARIENARPEHFA